MDHYGQTDQLVTSTDVTVSGTGAAALSPGHAARVVLSEPAIVSLLDEPRRPVLEENPV